MQIIQIVQTRTIYSLKDLDDEVRNPPSVRRRRLQDCVVHSSSTRDYVGQPKT